MTAPSLLAMSANKAYWLDVRDQYPFHAKAPTADPKAPDVLKLLPVFFVAIPMPDHVTFWGFENSTVLDRFLELYPQAGRLDENETP